MIESIDSAYIHAANNSNFRMLVLENSQRGPVLVNYWSKKAAPSIRQYPVLDKLVHEYNGKFLLINVDAEKEIEITKDCGITSVPTLKLYLRGQIVETLHGFQSESDLKLLLQKYVVRDSDRTLAEAIKYYAQGKKTETYDIIAQAIMKDPENPRLPEALCKILMHEKRYTEASELLSSLPQKTKTEQMIKLQDILDFTVLAQNIENVNEIKSQLKDSQDNLDARKRLVSFYVLQKEYENALSELMTMMNIDSSYEDQFAQKSILKIFSILGSDHELTKRFRAELLRYTH